VTGAITHVCCTTLYLFKYNVIGKRIAHGSPTRDAAFRTVGTCGEDHRSANNGAKPESWGKSDPCVLLGSIDLRRRSVISECFSPLRALPD
jgi:hypothetical protein